MTNVNLNFYQKLKFTSQNSDVNVNLRLWVYDKDIKIHTK